MVAGGVVVCGQCRTAESLFVVGLMCICVECELLTAAPLTVLDTAVNSGAAMQ